MKRPRFKNQLHQNELPLTCACGTTYAPGTVGFTADEDLADFKCEACLQKELERIDREHEEDWHPEGS